MLAIATKLPRFDLPESLMGASSVAAIVDADVENPNPKPAKTRNPSIMPAPESASAMVRSPQASTIRIDPVRSVSKSRFLVLFIHPVMPAARAVDTNIGSNITPDISVLSLWTSCALRGTLNISRR